MDPINVAAALLISGTNKAYAAKDVPFGDALASGIVKVRTNFWVAKTGLGARLWSLGS